MIPTRGSGLLLHITSLPSPYGTGDLGPAAYRFADLLAAAGQRYWQTLPITPTTPDYGHSPYSSPSAFALNTLLISPERMVTDDLLDPADLDPVPAFPAGRADFAAAAAYRTRIFDRAHRRFREAGGDPRYEIFVAENAGWLDDYALFVAIREQTGGQRWSEWPIPLRRRHPAALGQMRRKLSDRIEREYLLQYVAGRQWQALRRYCSDRKIHLVGDVPIYVGYDSADVWANPELFRLDAALRPTFVSGVPPDCFSRTGQLWGTPLFDWDAQKRRGYAWWIRRVARLLDLFTIIRIDHFRGFIDYWEVPAGDPTAEFGRWVDGPGMDFFERLADRFPSLPLIAEDLGENTPAIQAVLDRFDYPGMRVLLYAFAGDPAKSPHAPHNHIPSCILYTGTHDNNTVKGWYDEAPERERQTLFEYFGRVIPAGAVHRELVRAAMLSVARTAIVPVQDVLGMGGAARMNLPGTTDGNWEWRLTADDLDRFPDDWLRAVARIAGRVEAPNLTSGLPPESISDPPDAATGRSDRPDISFL
ncbi:4-alpha-glucanotransferase [Methanoculleus sp. FWC-SCC1]|uniref:4-alpha-glucanotransferase n=1 Tax=Methanoculleus frigidifontis TaxID=2584085 RepID=A0ABT8ME61_9EURY|nr:4-alpha-glucanotransferase [Methanoculleus sp. FWC-SCC1]MDN7026230.1 4-alpha-glucanotransferase [Methanoculleus sp. FWC-SCC1]